jgi:uncharacterized integral membrane protein
VADTQRRRGGTLGFVVGIIIAIPATIFALSNLESTNVEFLGWQAEVPLWAVMGVAFLAGALLGVIVLLAWQARRKRGKKKVAKQAAREKKAAEQDTTPALTGADAADVPAQESTATDVPMSQSPPAPRQP